MEFVLVSSCLIGNPVRYDGGHKRSGSEVRQRWLTEGRVVPVCPEIAGGLPVPRPPAEIAGGSGGAALLASAGVCVFSEAQFDEAAVLLRTLEMRDGAVSSRRRGSGSEAAQ